MKEKEYPIVAVIWEDHSGYQRTQLPNTDDLSELIRPSLTIGLLYKKTVKYIIVVQHVDRYGELDEADFMIIYRNAIIGMQEYGKIKISELRNKGD